ncbi:response regulator [bacterium]|nr:response regulator [bacterium]
MSKPLIMVVDDDKDVADEVSASIKETASYNVLTCYSAKDSLALLNKHNGGLNPFRNDITCVVLDIKMPDMNGLELLKIIRKDYGQQKIGVFLLTAYEDQGKWEKALEGQVASYIVKPVNMPELIKKLDTYHSNDEAPYDMIARTVVEGEKRIGELEG